MDLDYVILNRPPLLLEPPEAFNVIVGSKRPQIYWLPLAIDNEGDQVSVSYDNPGKSRGIASLEAGDELRSVSSKASFLNDRQLKQDLPDGASSLELGILFTRDLPLDLAGKRMQYSFRLKDDHKT